MKLSSPPGPCCRSVRFDLIDAVWNPRHDQRLDPVIPERAVNRVTRRPQRRQLRRGRRQLDLHRESRRRLRRAVVGCDLQDVRARNRERRRGHRCLRIGERHTARTGQFAPCRHRRGPGILDRDRRGFARPTAASWRFAVAGPAVEIGPAASHHDAIDSGGRVQRQRACRDGQAVAKRAGDGRYDRNHARLPHHVASRHRHEPIWYSFGGSASISQRTKKSQRRRIM